MKPTCPFCRRLSIPRGEQWTELHLSFVWSLVSFQHLLQHYIVNCSALDQSRSREYCRHACQCINASGRQEHVHTKNSYFTMVPDSKQRGQIIMVLNLWSAKTTLRVLVGHPSIHLEARDNRRKSLQELARCASRSLRTILIDMIQIGIIIRLTQVPCCLLLVL